MKKNKLISILTVVFFLAVQSMPTFAAPRGGSDRSTSRSTAPQKKTVPASGSKSQPALSKATSKKPEKGISDVKPEKMKLLLYKIDLLLNEKDILMRKIDKESEKIEQENVGIFADWLTEQLLAGRRKTTIHERDSLPSATNPRFSDAGRSGDKKSGKGDKSSPQTPKFQKQKPKAVGSDEKVIFQDSSKPALGDIEKHKPVKLVSITPEITTLLQDKQLMDDELGMAFGEVAMELHDSGTSYRVKAMISYMVWQLMDSGVFRSEIPELMHSEKCEIAPSYIYVGNSLKGGNEGNAYEYVTNLMGFISMSKCVSADQMIALDYFSLRALHKTITWYRKGISDSYGTNMSAPGKKNPFGIPSGKKTTDKKDKASGSVLKTGLEKLSTGEDDAYLDPSVATKKKVLKIPFFMPVFDQQADEAESRLYLLALNFAQAFIARNAYIFSTWQSFLCDISSIIGEHWVPDEPAYGIGFWTYDPQDGDLKSIHPTPSDGKKISCTSYYSSKIDAEHTPWGGKNEELNSICKGYNDSKQVALPLPLSINQYMTNLLDKDSLLRGGRGLDEMVRLNYSPLCEIAAGGGGTDGGGDISVSCDTQGGGQINKCAPSTPKMKAPGGGHMKGGGFAAGGMPITKDNLPVDMVVLSSNSMCSSYIGGESVAEASEDEKPQSEPEEGVATDDEEAEDGTKEGAEVDDEGGGPAPWDDQTENLTEEQKKDRLENARTIAIQIADAPGAKQGIIGAIEGAALLVTVYDKYGNVMLTDNGNEVMLSFNVNFTQSQAGQFWSYFKEGLSEKNVTLEGDQFKPGLIAYFYSKDNMIHVNPSALGNSELHNLLIHEGVHYALNKMGFASGWNGLNHATTCEFGHNVMSELKGLFYGGFLVSGRDKEFTSMVQKRWYAGEGKGGDKSEMDEEFMGTVFGGSGMPGGVNFLKNLTPNPIANAGGTCTPDGLMAGFNSLICMSSGGPSKNIGKKSCWPNCGDPVSPYGGAGGGFDALSGEPMPDCGPDMCGGDLLGSNDSPCSIVGAEAIDSTKLPGYGFTDENPLDKTILDDGALSKLPPFMESVLKP